MKSIRYALILCVALVAQLSADRVAYAATDFDNVIRTGGNFDISYKQTGINGYSACGATHTGDLSTDLRSNWSAYITDPTKYVASNSSQVTDGIDAYNTALSAGSGWGVVQHTSNMQYNNPTNTYLDVGSKYLMVWWSASSDLNFYHNTDGNYNALTYASNSNPVYIATLAYGVTGNNTCDVVTRMQVVGSGWHYNPEIINDVTNQQSPGNDTYAITFFNSSILYPDNYEGETPPSSEPPVEYVAMGDSFSSGEGNPSFEYGSDTGTNSCHRSPKAYPRLLEFDNSLNLGRTSFVACSGATTDDVLYGGSGAGNWDEGPQINALTSSAKVITLTVGGNDVGFKDFATACTLAECDFDTTAYLNISNKIINDLPGKLEDVYDAIDDGTSLAAQVYVIGYPQITPAEMPTGPNSACYPFNEGSGNPNPTLNDGAAAHAVVTELNAAIHTAVVNMNSSKFHFVDPNLTGSPFIGHDWCQQDRYFDIISYNNLSYSFHPNVDGHAAYKTIVKDALN